MIYHFVGIETTIAGRTLRAYGETIELDEREGSLAIAGAGPETAFSGSAPLLPAEQFESVGFTQDELRRFSSPGSHGEATPEFLRKKASALSLLHSLRLSLTEKPPSEAPKEL